LQLRSHWRRQRTVAGTWCGVFCRLSDMCGSEKRFLRIGAWIAFATCTVVLTAFVSSFVSPGELVVGKRWTLFLAGGKYSLEPSLERFEVAYASGNVAGRWLLLPSVADKPLWPLLAGTAVVGFVLLYCGRRRIVRGHCDCGYDLTGNVSGVCPECGATAQKRD